MATLRRSLVPALVGLLVGGLLVGPGRADAATTVPTFSRTDHPSLANHLVTGDFNGDGRVDLAGLALDAAAVLLADGDGTFGPRAVHPVADDPQDLAAGDFDRDGDLDLAVTVNSPLVSVSLLDGNGDGTFAAPVDIPNTTGLDSPAVVTADLDNDGVLDLVVAHAFACFTAPCRVGTTVSVLAGNGDGSFAPAREVEVGRGIADIAVEDFDRDGVKDLVFAGDSSRLYRLQGVGDGTFVQQPTITLTADTFAVDATDVEVADFNGDSVADVVVAIALNGSRTAILLGTGDGGFGQPSILTDPGLHVPQHIAVSDYNLDGFQDLAMALGNGNGGLVQLRNGNGDGTFQGPVNQQVPPNASSIGGVAILAARLDGDTRPDLALAWGGASTGLALLRNTTGSGVTPTPSAPNLVAPSQDAVVAQPVTLDWSDVNGAARYRVQVDDSSTFSSPLVLDQAVTASQLTTPTLDARRHWWRARAISPAGAAGPLSTVRRFTPQGVTTAPALSAVAVTPAKVVGGGSSLGAATLTGAAPAGGVVVSLTSSHPSIATVPASVTIAAGAVSASFSVSTAPVTASTPVAVSATYGGVTRTAALTVTPPAQTATLTVTATGRSGERITSTPAGINVAVGRTGSATFTVGTSVRLAVSDGRDATWSGGCSSGGSRTRTCTLTLSGDSTVTANVR